MIYAPDCICGRHLLQRENEGTCLLCGHGLAYAVSEHAYRRNLEHNRAPALSAIGVPRFDIAAARAVASAGHGSRFSKPRVRWDEETCVDAARRWEVEHGRLPTSADWQQARNGFHRPTYTQVREMFGGWQAFMREIADVPRERVAA